MKKIFALLAITIACAFWAEGVTFKVKVPAGTQKVYVCGAFNSWNADEAPQMESIGDNLFTLTLDNVTDVSGGYKYLNGHGWDYVEKDENGGEIDNRTTLGDPDVVGSWRNMPEYNIESVELTINNVKRLVKIYLPEGYDDSQETYPVIYYNTLQQRYSQGGADNSGDYFFGAASWNAHTAMESHRAEGHPAYIMVQVCSFLAENTPEENPEYKGTGNASQFLNAFVNELISYVDSNFRTMKGAENTMIVGADFGGLFALYASLTRPDVFGKCVAMSPMLWINEGSLDDMASSENASQVYYLSAGSREPQWMVDTTEAFAKTLSDSGMKAHFTLLEGAAHNDTSWGEHFPVILKAAKTGDAPYVDTTPEPDPDSNFAERTYYIYGASNTDYVRTTKKGELTYTTEYCRQGTTTPVKAMVYTLPLAPSSYKNKTYYWNVAEIVDGEPSKWVADKDFNVGFKDFTYDAWINMVVLEDGSYETCSANSQKFRVVIDNKDNIMTVGDNFILTATVTFPQGINTFEILSGSVNSGNKMDSPKLTGKVSVSENCTQAEITYNYTLNKVTVKELNGSTEPETPEVPEVPFKDRTYSLYAGETQTSLTKIGTLSFTNDFYKKGSVDPTEAFVITYDIPLDYSKYFYWNIAEGTDTNDGWVLSNVKDVSFNNRKVISWLNIALFEDGSVQDIAANKDYFRAVNGTKEYIMTASSNHTAKITMPFEDSDKTFSIYFGSVNSGSKMTAMTPAISVSDNCLEAEVTYDFHLNHVTVVETKHGSVSQLPKVTSMRAVPAVCVAGSDVRVDIEINTDCNVTLACKQNFSNPVYLDLINDGGNKYHAILPNASTGIYTFSVGLNDGSFSSTNASEINVKVLDSNSKAQKKLTVNAYNGVNWGTINRYKSNFHTHTSQSFDTQYTTTQVVDKYQKAGYSILALTDHDSNPYPWEFFDLYNPDAEPRNPAQMGMLAIPGNELSKDRRNSWDEQSGGNFNHHNDFFTGRKGQEFMSLRESYAYTEAIGGLQIINHPGQYWNRDKEYSAGEKNSPEWHAENFKRYSSLIGLEVYNQGNRRQYDRILWDQILTLTMPERPVWGYSCDDTHTEEQYFRNYQFMLMPALTVEDLKDAMNAGSTIFSYEYTGSGQAKAPSINEIVVDETNNTITIDSDDADKIEWIYSTHRTGSAASTTQSTVIGAGPTFDYSGYQGSYVRARLVNTYGETATQPFGFDSSTTSVSDEAKLSAESMLNVFNDVAAQEVTVSCTETIERITVINAAGSIVRFFDNVESTSMSFSTAELAPGVYVIVAATDRAAYTAKFSAK